jgi:hypothetical protein
MKVGGVTKRFCTEPLFALRAPSMASLGAT